MTTKNPAETAPEPAPKKKQVGVPPWLVAILGLAAILAMAAAYFRWLDLGTPIGGVTMAHWAGWTGAGLLAILVPAFSILKRRAKISYHTLLRAHVLGNIISFGFLSAHFGYQMSRWNLLGISLDTGFAIYLMVLSIVSLGVLMLYRLIFKNLGRLRFIHVGLSLSLVVIVPVHIATNVGLL